MRPSASNRLRRGSGQCFLENAGALHRRRLPVHSWNEPLTPLLGWDQVPKCYPCARSKVLPMSPAIHAGGPLARRQPTPPTSHTHEVQMRSLLPNNLAWIYRHVDARGHRGRGLHRLANRLLRLLQIQGQTFGIGRRERDFGHGISGHAPRLSCHLWKRVAQQRR